MGWGEYACLQRAFILLMPGEVSVAGSWHYLGIFTYIFNISCKLSQEIISMKYQSYCLEQNKTNKFHREFMSPALFLFEVLKMGKLTRGPLVLYHLPKY